MLTGCGAGDKAKDKDAYRQYGINCIENGSYDDEMCIRDSIRTIPDFPEKGIMCRDVTSVIQDADGLKLAIDEMIKKLDGLDFDVIAGCLLYTSRCV